MANEYLESSPSNQLLDPLIYNPFPEMNTTQSSDLNHVNKNIHSMIQSNQQQNQQQNLMTGWTPIIQRTLNNQNDQFIIYNSSPNRFNNSNLINNNEIEFELNNNLSLTPFINHSFNINNINNNNSNNNFSNSTNLTPQIQSITNITPFHDKNLQLNDFFMDSPLKDTPSKDTPSKFSNLNNITSVPHNKIVSNSDSNNSQKRSITQIDTPPRQANKMLQHRYLKSPIRGGTNFNFQTPSKPVLSNITNLNNNNNNNNANKTPRNKEFNGYDVITPAKPTSNSSPSTIIISSVAKSIRKEHLKKNKLSQSISDEKLKRGGNRSKTSDDDMRSNNTNDNNDNDDDDDDDENLTDPETCDENKTPVSPTPINKNSVLPCKTIINGDESRPPMGIFQDKKKVMSNSSSSMSKKNNVPKMSAGMNRFQIVFTDVHSLMNNKNSKSKKNSNKGKLNRSQTNVLPKNKIMSNSSANSHGVGDKESIDEERSKRNLGRSTSLPLRPNYMASDQRGPNEEETTGITPIMKSTLSLHRGNSQITPMNNKIIPLQYQSSQLSQQQQTGQVQDFLELNTPDSKYLIDRMFERSPFGISAGQTSFMYGTTPTPPHQHILNQRMNLKLQAAHQFQQLQMQMQQQQQYNSPLMNRFLYSHDPLASMNSATPTGSTSTPYFPMNMSQAYQAPSAAPAPASSAANSAEQSMAPSTYEQFFSHQQQQGMMDGKR